MLRRVVALSKTPVAAAHLLKLRPAIECCERNMTVHDAFSRADEVHKRSFCALAPPARGFDVVDGVTARCCMDHVQDDDIVGRERFRTCPAELLHHAHLEPSGDFEHLPQQRGRLAPRMTTQTRQNQRLYLLWVEFARLSNKSSWLKQAADQHDSDDRSPHHFLPHLALVYGTGSRQEV